jgi:hypothetical protein
MNTKNLDYLKNGIKYLGFGEALNAELEKNISAQPKEFQLTHSMEFKKGDTTEKVDYKLDLRKSDKSDMYFLNRVNAKLNNEDPSNERSQTFYITNNNGVTAKEAYNLLSGRSVHKDLVNKDKEEFKAWLKLDFTEKDGKGNFKVNSYHAGYGYELEKVLGSFPIKEIAHTYQKDRILQSLEKGNMVSVTFLKDDKESKMFVEANPQFKTLNVYDGNMKKVFQESAKKETKGGEEKSKENNEKQIQESGTDDDAKPEKRATRRKRLGM